MKILLDTNFVLTCSKQKIDFETLTEELISERIEWMIPQEVLNELGNIKNRTGIKREDKEAAALSFTTLQHLKPTIIKLTTKNPNVDMAIVNFVLGKKIVLATLDKELQSRIPNMILTIKGKKQLQLLA